MKEYIERAAAMEAIFGLTIVDPAVAQYANAVCYHLQNIPAADVAEVRHGYWKFPVFTDVYKRQGPGYRDYSDCIVPVKPICKLRRSRYDYVKG